MLRRWRESDRDSFHDLNSDPAVMATIGPVMSRAGSDAFLNRIEERFDATGFGLWCVEHEGDAVGFTGFMEPWFRGGVEIGWRIRSRYWGRGFATEAAEACLEFAFRPRDDGGLGFEEVMSFTAVTNAASRRVMEKLGMRRDPDGDFDHPGLPEGDPLRPHVLYRIRGVDRVRAGYGAGS
ncbi:MAG: GNAT family N-acetyltransferase [Ilumatobacteraceae bacterium]